MSEVKPASELESFDSTFVGERVRQIFADVQDYQELIDQQGATRDELLAIVADLDSKWPYQHENLLLTGRVLTPMQVDSDEPSLFEGKTVFVEDTKVQSNGFGIHMAPIEGQDEPHPRLGLYFIFQPESLSKRPMIETFAIKEGFALPDEVMITFPSAPEVELFDQVHYYFPEFAQDIDEALLNARDETAAVMALDGLYMPVRSEDTLDGLGLITDYVNSRLHFDEMLPYSMQFEGLCFTVNDEGGLLPSTAEPGSVLAYPLRVETLWENKGTPPGSSLEEIGISFGLRIVLVNETRAEDDGVKYVIPINESFSMKGIRPLVYTAMKHEVEAC